jgi:hypothetical protein
MDLNITDSKNGKPLLSATGRWLDRSAEFGRFFVAETGIKTWGFN